MKRSYELVLVLPSRIESKERDTLITKIKTIITDNDAKIDKEEVWGDKELAYPIKHEKAGHYLIWSLTAETTKLSEMKRILNFETQILRYLLLQVTTK